MHRASNRVLRFIAYQMQMPHDTRDANDQARLAIRAYLVGLPPTSLGIALDPIRDRADDVNHEQHGQALDARGEHRCEGECRDAGHARVVWKMRVARVCPRAAQAFGVVPGGPPAMLSRICVSACMFFRRV